MVVYGFHENGSDHDQTLMAVLQIAQANNFEFNSDKFTLVLHKWGSLDIYREAKASNWTEKGQMYWRLPTKK